MSTLQTLIALRCDQKYEEALKLGKELMTFLPNFVRLIEEMVLIFYFTNHKEDAYRCIERILLLRPTDKNVLSRALFNLKLFHELYVDNEWTPMKTLSVTEPPVNQIILTITTCKRFNLFQRTMKSFLRSCVDLNWITTFICVDDNSSDSDRLLMKKNYPFFKFIWKTQEQKGHSLSMQLLVQKLKSLRVKPRFILHLEDDWEFLTKVSIQDIIEIIYDGYSKGVRQVAFNKNYSELPSQNIIGGKKYQTQSNLMYYVHEHVQTEEQKVAFDLKHGQGLTCHYWPHFTLQPSIVCFEIFDKITFQSGLLNFEMNFARQYTEQGWKTAFLTSSLCKHIGKLLNDNNTMNQNAYQLNNEQR